MKYEKNYTVTIINRKVATWLARSRYGHVSVYSAFVMRHNSTTPRHVLLAGSACQLILSFAYDIRIGVKKFLYIYKCIDVYPLRNMKFISIKVYTFF